MIPFSFLDLSPVIEGGDAQLSFSNSVDMARHAEELGFNRYWFAEHHNLRGVASSATAVLIAHVAAATQSIRLGAGGIMLPNHAPLVIAEQFGTLETLHPGRIDLGLGRAPGGDQLTAQALRRTMVGGEDRFPEDVEELLGYLDDPDPANPARVAAVPGEGTKVPIWILGSSLFGAQMAAHMGLPYAFASHFAPGYLMQAADVYRRTFKPSRYLDAPYFMMACNVFAADDADDAAHHFSSLVQAFAAIAMGRSGPLPKPRTGLQLPPAARQRLDQVLQASAVGNLDQVTERLQTFVDRLKPDELIIASQFHSHEARKRSLELTMEARQRLVPASAAHQGQA